MAVRRQLAVPDGQDGGVGGLRQSGHQRAMGVQAAGEERAAVQIEDRPRRGCAGRAHPFGGAVLGSHGVDARGGPDARQQAGKTVQVFQGPMQVRLKSPGADRVFTINRLARETATDCGLCR